MAIRNFWMEANVDGRDTAITGGTKSKDGGMSIKIHIRNKGGSQRALTIYCMVNNEGKLQIDVFDAQKKETVYTIETER